MKKTRSKRKTASNSKRQQIKKISQKHSNHNAPKLCSCIGQVSSDLSSENLAGEGESHYTTDCSHIQLPLPAYMKRWTSKEEFAPTEVAKDKSHAPYAETSKPVHQEGGIPGFQNRVLDPVSRGSHRPTKTKSAELIRLFYTIVADDDFSSEQSDSEDAVTSNVQHEVEVDVHHDTTTKGVVVDKANESRSHSVHVQNADRDDPVSETWFATRNEPSPSTVDPNCEGALNLTGSTKGNGHCDQSSPTSDETDASILGINCKESTQQFSNEEEYKDFRYEEERDNMFPKESFLYVIDEVPEEDCDSNSNISVETVKDMTLAGQSSIGIQDTPTCVPKTQFDTSFVDGKDTRESVSSAEDDIAPCNDAVVDNNANQILINDEQRKPMQPLDNPTSSSHGASIVFSQDQAITEIIASGNRMVDEVKELISELLDVCMQSRANDVASVAAHGDFAEASETSSRATYSDNAESTEIQNNINGKNNQRVGISEGCGLARKDVTNSSPPNEPKIVDQCRNDWPSQFEAPSNELDLPVDQCDNNELSLPFEKPLEEPDIHVDRCRNNENSMSLDSPSLEAVVPIDQYVNNDQSLHFETSVVEEILGSSNNQCAADSIVESRDCGPHETQLGNEISDAQCDVTEAEDEKNPIELLMSHNQQVPEIVENDEMPNSVSENLQPEFGDTLCRTDEVWPVKKIKGCDLACVMPIQETNSDKFDQDSHQILKIVGVNIAQTEEAPLKNIVPEEDRGRDVQTPFENQIMKIVGVNVEMTNVDVDHVDLCDIQKVIGVDVVSHLPVSVATGSCSSNVQVDEEGDPARMKDMSLCDCSKENEILESGQCTELLSLEDLGQDVSDKSKDGTSGDGDTILATGGIVCDDKEFNKNVNVAVEKLDAETSEHEVSPSAHKDATEDASSEVTCYRKIQTDMTIQRKAQSQENDSPSDCTSPTSEGSNVSSRSPSVSRSSFEILSQGCNQELLEDNFDMVPYSPSIIVPPPQEEYNEVLMSPEFEADDIIVNVATVSAMGDVAPSPPGLGISPVAPPDPVQFRDVNSRSPSPLPQTDFTLLDRLFDICEESLQRIPYKIEHLGLETYVNEKSKSLKLSPDCLGEQGDSRTIQNMSNQRSSAVTKELFGSISGEDEGFSCCDPPSSDSYISLSSTDAVPGRPLTTEDFSEKYFSFDTLEGIVGTEEEQPLPQEMETRSDIFQELGFQQNLGDHVILYDFIPPNRTADVSLAKTDETSIVQLSKEPHVDNPKPLQTTSGTLNSSMAVVLGKEEDTYENFVFLLALFTFSMFVYCKYGTRVLQTITHWIWICQLIIQLFADS